MSNAHAYMMSQDAKGISFSIDEETLAFMIQSVVNNTMETASQACVLRGYPRTGRPGLRLAQL
eukprot:1927001-Pyramimonas_sp.AAC.1